MGQVLQLDKIGSLTESGGTITLAPSVLTIGGQQYSTPQLSVPVDTSSSNTRYQIYAVLNSGVVTLVTSQNENSAGPTGYNAWKLVGSYYTDGLSPIGFGSFVEIEGAPMTDWIGYTPQSNWPGTHKGKWRRVGDSIEIRFALILSGVPPVGRFQSSASQVFNGMGITVDVNKLPDDGDSVIAVGSAQALDAGVNIYTGNARYVVSADIFIISGRTVNTGLQGDIYYNSPFAFNVNDKLGFYAQLPITNWNNKPIKDL